MITVSMPIRVNLDKIKKGTMLDGELTVKAKDKSTSSKVLQDVYDELLKRLCPPCD